MVIDPSDTQWEISQNLGTMYVATSRGKTLGSKGETYPLDSAIYWTGCNVSMDRIHNCKRKQDGQPCESFKKREKWVNHLKEKADLMKTIYTKRKIDEITKTTYAAAMRGDLIQDRTDLTRRITDIITNPNEKWKKAKKEYQLPTDYFS